MRVSINHQGKIKDCVSNDLSESGIQLRHEETLTKDDKIKLKIFLPYKNPDEYKRQIPLSIEGIVRWANDSNNPNICGIEFIDTNEPHRQWMKKCFAFFDSL